MLEHCESVTENGNAVGVAGSCSCTTATIGRGQILSSVPPIHKNNNLEAGMWKKFRSGLMFSVAFITSPCCSPFIVPMGLALFAGTPVAMWLSVNIGWVYGGLTLFSTLSLVLGYRWLKQNNETRRKVMAQPAGNIYASQGIINDFDSKESSSLACDLTAIPAEVREEHVVTASQLFKAAQEVVELPNGYAIRFLNEPSRFMAVAKFIENDRQCCPFFNFELELNANNGPLWVRLTGGEGVKEILQFTLFENFEDKTALKQLIRSGGDAHLDEIVEQISLPLLGDVLKRTSAG